MLSDAEVMLSLAVHARHNLLRLKDRPTAGGLTAALTTAIVALNGGEDAGLQCPHCGTEDPAELRTTSERDVHCGLCGGQSTFHEAAQNWRTLPDVDRRIYLWREVECEAAMLPGSRAGHA